MTTHVYSIRPLAKRMGTVAIATCIALSAAFMAEVETAQVAQAQNNFDGMLFTLINQDRAQNGVAPLAWNSQLSSIAEDAPYGGCGYTIGGRAQDMLQRNYFAHTLPNCGNQNVFNILQAYRVPYSAAGENIQWTGSISDPNAAAAYQNTVYMNSPEHRANILNPAYTSVGVGSATTGPGQGYQGAANVTISVEVFSNGPGTGPPPPPAMSPPPPTPVLGRYFKPGAGHWVTTGGVTSDYVGRAPGTEETALGSLSTSNRGGMWALYSCAANTTHFLSTDPRCEGQQVIRTDGFAATTPTTGFGLEIFRCRTNSNDHFVTTNRGCEGWLFEESLGYIAPGIGLARYYGPGGHWSAAGAVTSGYNSEAVLGYLNSTALVGTHMLYGCMNGQDHFTSLAANCENTTVLGPTGQVNDGNAAGTLPLYRCYTGHDHLDTTSGTCEGAGRLEELLGYVRQAP